MHVAFSSEKETIEYPQLAFLMDSFGFTNFASTL